MKRPCSGGSASEVVIFGVNSQPRRQVWTITVTVMGAAGSSLARQLKLTQKAQTFVARPTPKPVTTPKPVPTAPPVAPPPAAAASPTAALLLSTTGVPSSGGAVTLSYSSVNASSCTLLSTPAIWAGADPATVNCNGSYAATVQAASAAQQWTLTFTATSASGQSAVSTQTLAELAPPFALNASWSGYVLPSSSAAFTDATGSWAVPTLNFADTPDGGESA